MRRQTTSAAILDSIKNRGLLGWFLFVVIGIYYVVLYLGAHYEEPTNAIERFQAAVWPATEAMDRFAASLLPFVRDQQGVSFANRWTLYGLLYTLAIGAGGVYVMRKYRHNRYQLVRTSVVIFVQVSFAFSIPLLLRFFEQPELYFSYLWPLKIDVLDPRNFGYYGPVYVIYGFIAATIAVPILTLLYGKRWYCSWVCGCGGLANTFGEPWRHLSNTSARAWRFEKISIHAVLIVAVLSTGMWLLSSLLPDLAWLQRSADFFRRYYGLFVVAVLSGVVGVALYPIAGTRVWCRYFCPMAALLGLIQKFGRFHIRVKKDMCISCGRCSEYCEMGIDVRAYAQANTSFTRASCVGCGLCAEVCPRGVLRLENRSKRDPQELNLQSFINESWKAESSYTESVL